MSRDEYHLKEFLYEAGFLSRAQVQELERAAEADNETFVSALLKSGILSEDEARRAIAKSLSIPFVELQGHDFQDEALVEIPEPFCRAFSVVAASKMHTTLTVVFLDFPSKEAVEALRLPFIIKWQLTDRQTIKRGLLQYQKFLKDTFAADIASDARSIVPPISESLEDIVESAKQPAALSVLTKILQHASSQRAQHIHFEPRERGLLIRYRIGGLLYDAMLLPAHTAPVLAAHIKLASHLLPGTRRPQEGRFKIISEHISQAQLAVRVTTIPLQDTEKLVLHVVHEHSDKNNFTLESLGFHGRGLEMAHGALQQNGLLLVYGPAASGKTTLLYTLLDLLVDPTRSVASLEDHIELSLPGVIQTEISKEQPNGGILFRSLLKMDPDSIMVSPFTSPQVVVPAAHAANTGILVLADLQVPSFGDALVELARDIPTPVIASVVKLLIGIRLVRRLCDCHVQEKLTRTELQTLEERGANLALVLETLKEEECIDAHAQWKDLLFGKPKSCDQCQDGYRGRTGLQELTPETLYLKDLIVQQADTEAIERAAQESRPLSLLEEGIYKAARGLTSIDEVLAATL